MAAGTVTETVQGVAGSGTVRYATLNWTSDAAGNVSGDVVNLPTGSIITVVFTPGTGASQPTNLYDVDLLDALGISLFDDGTGTSIGANLSNVNSKRGIPFIGGATTTYVRTWLFGGMEAHQLTVANAGANTSGTVYIFVSTTIV